MTDKIKNYIKKIFERIPERKRPIVIIISGILMLAVIVLPDIIGNKKETKQSVDSVDTFREQYAESIEERLCDIISSIEGAGRTKVMVTLDCTEENIYATDINSERKEYVVIKTDDGEGGMLLKIIKPKIRGVAVVCEGGDNATVRVDIINTVCSSLGITSTRISIAKMKDRGD